MYPSSGLVTSVGTYGSGASHDDAAFNVVKSVSEADAKSEDARVLQDAVDGQLGVVKPVTDCESLLGVDLSHIAEDGSATVTSAAESTHEGVVYCNVEGTPPASTKWQVMLPVRTWTQRYMQVGCGGLCGMIRMQVNAASGSQQVRGGEFVLAATGMGGAMDGKVLAHSPERRKSFAHSAALDRAGEQDTYASFLRSEAAILLLQWMLGQRNALSVPDSLHHGWLAMSNIDGPMPELPPMMRGPPPGPEQRSPRRHGSPGRHSPPGPGMPGGGPTAIVTASKSYYCMLLSSALVTPWTAWSTDCFLIPDSANLIIPLRFGLQCVRKVLFCDSNTNECRTPGYDDECYDPDTSSFGDGCADDNYECVDSMCQPIVFTCSLVCISGEYCESGTDECRGPDFDGECFNANTGTYQDGCDPGFECLNNQCVGASNEDWD
ncbi:unnamed protein product [Phytophthora lilii]|uniref:feruloyl esterase n=1 Tax=Phytophthora lilii TaxID=2077276 RepID=A0A9W6TW48_9STRA|nr:unnamed protein product [Phytophthora lilii]